MGYDIVGMGNRIYIARQSKGLKQLEMCQKLSMSQANYSNIESGKQEVSVTQLVEIASILDVSASWLIGEDIIPDLTDKERLELENYKNYLVSKRK
jgi:transcriptional regulator with XRE-family HTH domain